MPVPTPAQRPRARDPAPVRPLIFWAGGGGRASAHLLPPANQSANLTPTRWTSLRAYWSKAASTAAMSSIWWNVST